MSDQKNQLEQIIKDAFADTPYPKDNQIGQSHEKDFIDEQFKGKKWQDISVETLLKCRTDLMYFTDNAFRYFLPAFMIGVVLHEHETDTLATNLITQLTPPKALKDYLSSSSLENLTKGFLIRAQLFNTPEIQAIIAFLKFYADLHVDDGHETQAMLIDEAIAFWKSNI